MAYQLQSGETISEGLKRILREETDLIIRLLTQGDDLHRSVHETRKACKRIRAVWRLVRDQVGHKAYRRENATYRDASRDLSRLRDLSALLETLDQLEHLPLSSQTRTVWERARQDLEALRDQAEAAFSQDILAEVAERVSVAQVRIEKLTLKTERFKAIEKGFHRVYRRSHRGLRHSQKKTDAERMHDWRKRVKYLRFHVQLMQPIWPTMMEAFGSELHRLSDYLGDHHDLAVLSEFLQDQVIITEPIAGKDEFMALLEAQQMTLAQHSFELGERLFLNRPADFVFEVRQYWELWRQHQLVA